MNLRQKVFNGILWSSIERFSGAGISFLISIFIARLLSPSDYGIIAMLSIFFSFFNVFVDSGFGSALIRKVDRSESDNSTVFYFNILVGFIASLTFFLLAPFIADFFGIAILTPITRILSTTVFISSFSIVQQALLTSRIDFKTQAKISLTTTIVSGCLGLWYAYSGFGVWALVIQMMVASILRSILLWTFVKWTPTMPFSRTSFKNLFGFGSKLLASSLLEITYNNIYVLVIGKLFSTTDLGNYSRANQFAQFPSSNITNIIQRVTFPALSHIQDEDERLSVSYRKILRMSSFIIFPLMIGLAAIAYPLIVLLLTEKWAGAVIYFQIICFALMWFPIHAINLNILQVKGRSDLFLRVELIKKVIGVSILLITIPMGLVAMCFGQIITSLICLVVNTYYTSKLINLGFLKQMRDLSSTLMASLIMGATVYLMLPLLSERYIQLPTGIIIGVSVYSLIAYTFRFKELRYLRELIMHK